MSSVRLYAHQVEYLRRSCNGAAVIATAIRRYKRGDFVTYLQGKRETSENVLQVYSLAKKPPIPAELLRRILDLHLTVKDETLKRRLEEANRIVAELEKVIFAKPYILEESKE